MFLPRLIERRDDERLEDCLVHVGQALDIEAALAGPVPAELVHERLMAREIRGQVEDELAGARREADPAHLAAMSAFILIAVAAEANDGRSPHRRRKAADPLHHRAQLPAVLAALRVGHSVEEII